jgi:phospholipid/cholesterol/gamma-HCH transport system substrate-binding protein
MNERQLQFRIGLFVIAAGLTAVGLLVRFGELRWLWEKNYTVLIQFDDATGLHPGSLVRKNGVIIGSVRELFLEDEQSGVQVVLSINEEQRLRRDSVPRLTRTLLGDASIDFTPGRSGEFIKPGTRIEGQPDVDLNTLVTRLESKLSGTMATFEATSEEWRKVGQNMNSLVETERGNLRQIIEQAALSLQEFTVAMNHANRVLGDERNQENLQKALAALPAMVDDTRRTIQAVRGTVVKMDQNLDNLNKVTTPLAERSLTLVRKLDSGVEHLEGVMAELHLFSKALTREDGTFQQLATNPDLYRNLNQSAASLQILMKNLDPVVKDMRIFADKVARHPELIGVGGAFKGSSGLK